jgi:hypothetical protein
MAISDVACVVFSFDCGDRVQALDNERTDYERDILGSLVEKSSCRPTPAAAPDAIACFDTTRTYAQGKLDRADERAATARRMRPTCCHVLDHENHVADGAHAMLEHLGNIRAALAWSFSGAGDRASAWHLPRRRRHYSSHCRSLASAHRWAELALGAFSDADRGTRLEMDLQAAVGVALMFTRTPVNDRWAINCTSSPMAPTISGKDN